MEPRAVNAAHGWAWIVQGYLLFRKSPAIWLALLVLLLPLISQSPTPAYGRETLPDHGHRRWR